MELLLRLPIADILLFFWYKRWLYNVLINARRIRAKKVANIKKIGAKSLPIDFVDSWELATEDSFIDGLSVDEIIISLKTNTKTSCPTQESIKLTVPQ